MKRRNFLRSMAAAGMAATVGGAGIAVPGRANAAGKVSFGEVRNVKVDVLSETSWFNNDIMKKNMMDYGGAMTNQYTVPWDWENAGGYAALITVTNMDGSEKKILLDSGWNTEWMDYIFQEKSNVAQMLQKGEIDTMVISHFHLDHYWAIASTLKHKPDITIFAPNTYYPEDMALLKEKAHLTAKDKDGKEVPICSNDYPHTGKLNLCKADGEKGDGIYQMMPGVAYKVFDVPILLRVRGEGVLYFNVKDKGIVTITGCCHPGLLSIFSFARQNFEGYKPYGCYGGLHVSLFENWDPKFDDLIKGVKAFKIEKVACNHCTGWIWAEKASQAGIPIVKGTDKFKTYKKQSTVAKSNNVFLTNGDSILF